MSEVHSHTWKDPHDEIWGFHIHQEVNQADFAKSLIIQEKYEQFLKTHNINVDSSDAFRPGYGPHIYHMWEIRIESENVNLLEKLGTTVVGLCLNHNGMAPYIHPLKHNRMLPETEALKEEGEKNQKQTIWFEKKTFQDQSFFSEPPKDQFQNILNTRQTNILSSDEIKNLKEQGHNSFSNETFDNFINRRLVPNIEIEIFHNNLQEQDAQLLLKELEHFIVNEKNESSLHNLGFILGWLMCNRGELSIALHFQTESLISQNTQTHSCGIGEHYLDNSSNIQFTSLRKLIKI